MVAHIIYEKCGRHLPLNRIDVELRRLGGEIREVTRDRWLQWAARHLDCLLPSLKTELFIEGLLHTDGTGLPVLDTGTKVRLGQIAVFCNAHAVIYEYTASKHGRHQRVFLGLEDENGKEPKAGTPRFSGHQVADASSIADRTYLGGAIVECSCNGPSRRAPPRDSGPALRSLGGLSPPARRGRARSLRVACGDHARRMFEKAEATELRLASEGIAFFGMLYRVERQANKLDDAGRLALTYLNNHWDALFRFLTDGPIPIDNNLAERMPKAIAVGRRSYMFAGNDRAAERSATFYTWVETCRLHGVDPPTWLADVLPRIPTTRPSDYADLLPRRWAELRQMRIAA